MHQDAQRRRQPNPAKSNCFLSVPDMVQSPSICADRRLDDQTLPNPIVSSSPLRKLFPILALGGEDGDDSRCIICVDGVAMRRHTHGGWAESIIRPRSRYPNPQILAESIMWWRSRYRGVDFCASQASGVDFMGLNEFKILKGKSQKNRLRV